MYQDVVAIISSTYIETQFEELLKTDLSKTKREIKAIREMLNFLNVSRDTEQEEANSSFY